MRPQVRSLLMIPLLLSGIPASGQQEGVGVEPPTSDRTVEGEIDVRYRWVQDIRGNKDVYRSVVNLGEGVRLYGFDLRYDDPDAKLADELTAAGNGWGGDPYNWARLDMKLSDVYDLRVNYRNVAYFNNLPSFANPLLSDGLLFSQRALDVTRRQFDVELRVKTNARISPFVHFYNAQGFGSGVTTYVSNGNEFPVSTGLDDMLNSARGGVRLNFEKYNFTLEQGWTGFDDDQRIFFDDGGNPGNRRGPLLGRDIVLDQLDQRYRASGSGPFNRGVVQGRPAGWWNFTGQFLYSRPRIDVTTDLTAAGAFLAPGILAPYTQLQESSVGDAGRPHSSGSWSNEFRVNRRFRILQNWYTDRFHVAGGSTAARALNTEPNETSLEQALVSRLSYNYSQHQVDAVFDVARRFTIRGGHRYVWGDALAPAADLQLGPEARNRGAIRRHVALAGAAFRAGTGFSLTADVEASAGDKTLFRKGLMDYKKARLRARYRLRPDLTFNVGFSILDNKNSQQDIDFDFQSRQITASVLWTPGRGERFSLLGDYTRSALRSDIPILTLPFFGSEFSRYRDRGHHAGALADFGLPGGSRLRAGGALSVNSGSRPTKYFQPRVSVTSPTLRRVKLVAEWRWYGFSEDFYRLEDFRSHTFSAGVQFGI